MRCKFGTFFNSSIRKFSNIMQDGQIAGDHSLSFDYHSSVRKPERRTQLIADPNGHNIENRVNPQPSF